MPIRKTGPFAFERADDDALPSEFGHREDRIGSRIEIGSLRLAAVAGEIRLCVESSEKTRSVDCL
jgi:hypothetical protein